MLRVLNDGVYVDGGLVLRCDPSSVRMLEGPAKCPAKYFFSFKVLERTLWAVIDSQDRIYFRRSLRCARALMGIKTKGGSGI